MRRSLLMLALLGSSHAFAAMPPKAAPAKLSPAITQRDFDALVWEFSSDAMEGRGPGTVGETRATESLRDAFIRAGLKPGYHGSWFQNVDMVVSRSNPDAVMHIDAGGKRQDLAFGTDMVVATRSERARIALKDSPIVFVGYGVNAPEQGWNDYAGLDVKGKTVLMFVNDPGFHAQDATLFEGKRMTYYGRWTYKFEEAARQGAAAAILIHDDAGAAYGWGVIKNGWSGKQYDLPVATDPAPRVGVQSWITNAQAHALFAAAGLDYDAMLAAAGKRGFKPVPLAANVSVEVETTLEKARSRNVIGMLPGTSRKDEAIVFQAHWDHLGKHEGESGDNIYNGAVDNGTGMAALVEIAHKFSGSGKRPHRTLLFFAPTLEESGLLGSAYYVKHPVIPLAKTVAVVNFDAMRPMGKTQDIQVVGRGNSELEDLLDAAVKRQGRSLSDEPTPEDGFYFRSDHFNFAKAGVPALYGRSGTDLLQGGRSAGDAFAADYVRNRYHKPSDEIDARWDSAGIVEDLNAFYDVAAQLANSGAWPKWRDTSAFRKGQQALEAERAAPAKPRR